MAKQNQEDKTKMNPVLWFFFAIVIPLAVALTITVVVLAIAGVDVAGWTKDKASNIPGVSSLIDKESKTNGGKEATSEQINDRLKAKDEQIDKLKEQIDELEGTVDSLEQDIAKQKNKEKSNINAGKQADTQGNTAGATGTEQKGTAQNDPVKKMASSFKKMDPAQAALIVQDLSNDMAIDLMNELSTQTRGQVLQEMEPKKAADLTERIIKKSAAVQENTP